MEKLIINETANTLLKCMRHMYEERLDCLIIPHSYDGKQINAIRPHCFNRLIIGLPCIENGVKYLSDSIFEDACVLNANFPRSLKLAKNALQTSDCGKFFCPDICIPLRTRHDFGYQFKQPGKGLFDGYASLSCLKLEGPFDKLEPETFAGANGAVFSGITDFRRFPLYPAWLFL